MYKIVIDGQLNLLVLISAFIIGGVFKSKNLFSPLFISISAGIKSKRFALFLISLISGILPVEGRVSISAPILDSIIRKTDNNEELEKKRAKLGILDYLSTHHYYLWSPIEKSIILLMGGLGLSYGQVLAYTTFPLIVYFCFLVTFIFNYIDENDIIYKQTTKIPFRFNLLLNIIPFIFGIALSIVYPPYYVFPIIAIFYIIKNKVGLREVISFIKWKSICMVGCIIILANILKANADIVSSVINAMFSTSNDNIYAVIIALITGCVTALVFGSSTKYAGICVALTLTFGMKLFPIILMAEYVGYLLSPTHKCLAISVTYFKTDIRTFYNYIGSLSFVLILIGIFMSIWY